MDRTIRLASIRTCKHAWRLPASTSRWNLRGQKGGGYVQPYGQFRIFMSHNENSLRATSCAQFLSSYAKAPEYYFQAGPYSSQRRHRAIEMFQKAKSGLYCGPRSLLLSENFILQPQNPWDISYTKRRKSVHETTHTVCTIDCIPYNDFKHYEVAVIDEVHLIDDPVRGHAWVKAIQELNADQIYICGEATAISIVERLVASRGGQLQVKNYEQQTKFSLQKKPLCSYRNAKEGDCIVCCDKNRALEIAAEIEQYNLATAVKYDTLPNRLKLAQLQSFNDERGQAKVLVCTDVMEAGYNIKANRFILDDMRLFKSCYNDAEISRLVHHIKGRAKTIKYSKLTNELACRSREDLLFVADILKVHPHMIAEVPGREQQDNEHHNDDHLTTQQLVQGHDLTQKIEASCDMTEKLELAEKWFSELEKMPKHERGSTEALTELEHLHQQTDHFLRLFESSPMDAARLQKVQNLQEHITRKINMTLEVILRPQKGLDITLYEADYVDISIKAQNIKHNSLLASDTVNEESHVCISDETQIIEHSSLLASDTVNEESYVCISDETQIFEHSSLLASDTANEESHVCISDETQNIEHSSLLASDTVSEKIGAFTSGDMKYTGEYISIFDSLSTNAVEKDITPKQQIKSGESVQIDTENAAPSPASGLPHPKNALQLLNDLKPGIRYHVISQEGPVHDPSFTMGEEMNGQIFEGKGPTKNKARRKAAEQALYSLGQDLHSDTTAHASSNKKAEGDFTGDDTKENIENQAASMDTSADVTVGMKRGGDPPCAGENKMRKTGGAGGPSQTKNALKLLNQRDFSYRVIAIEGPVHHPSYTIALEVNGQMFEGKGSSKSLARRKAFEQALYTLSQELHSVSTAHASSIKKAEGDFIGDDTEGDIETTGGTHWFTLSGGTHVKSSESTRVSRIFHEGFHDEMPISQNESHPNHIPNPHDKPITGGINSLLNFWKKLSKTMSKISLKGSINSNKTQAQGVNGKALPWNDRAAGSLDQEQASTSHDRAATASENACALTWNDVASTWNERAIKKSSKSDNHGLEEAEEENSEYGHLLGKRASRKESTSTGNRSSFADMLSNKIETVKVRKNARKAYSHETLRMLNFNEMRTKSEKTRAAKPYKPFKNVKQGRTRVLIQPETTFESERYEGVNKAVSIKTSKMKAAYEQSNVEFFESLGDSGKTPVSIKKPHTLDENPSDFADCSIVEEKSENATSIESFKTVPRNSSQTLGKEAFLSESVKVESEARQKSAPKSYKNPHWFED